MEAMIERPRAAHKPDEWIEVSEPSPAKSGDLRVVATVPARGGGRREVEARTVSFVDFATVPTPHWPMHRRLENWARWSRGMGRQSGSATPMFSGHRSDTWDQREYGAATSVPVEPRDALAIHFAIVRPDFPPQERRALQWWYLRGGKHPAGAARELCVDLRELADLVQGGRATLIAMDARGLVG